MIVGCEQNAANLRRGQRVGGVDTERLPISGDGFIAFARAPVEQGRDLDGDGERGWTLASMGEHEPQLNDRFVEAPDSLVDADRSAQGQRIARVLGENALDQVDGAIGVVEPLARNLGSAQEKSALEHRILATVSLEDERRKSSSRLRRVRRCVVAPSTRAPFRFEERI